MKKNIRQSLFATLVTALSVSPATSADNTITLKHLSSYETGIFNKSAAEIIAYNKSNHHFYIVNAALDRIDRFHIKNNNKIIPLPPLKLKADESPTSVAVNRDLIAVAVHDKNQDRRPGKIVLFNAPHQNRITDFPAGSLPDMVTFSPDGQYILAANEGEPRQDIDPDGSITIVKINQADVRQSRVKQLSFGAFDTSALRKSGVRIAPGKSFSKDAEPEYIAVTQNSDKAWVSLQENNALAEIDLREAKITRILPLGVKDHSLRGQGLDPNDKDGFNIIHPPVVGMYMPDAIATIRVKNLDYILTANEGDARDEEIKASAAVFDKKSLTKNQIKSLGNLRVSSTDGDRDQDGDIDIPHSYGTRSFSIFSHDGKLIFDSGEDFERITGERYGAFFNSDNDMANSGDSRSDNKGPEPEGITTGMIKGHIYAFITLERIGGVMIYDVSIPEKPVLQSYYNSRKFNAEFDFERDEDRKKAGFLGPEGVLFISREDSPFSTPLLLIANEVSGSVEILTIN